MPDSDPERSLLIRSADGTERERPPMPVRDLIFGLLVGAALGLLVWLIAWVALDLPFWAAFLVALLIGFACRPLVGRLYARFGVADK